MKTSHRTSLRAALLLDLEEAGTARVMAAFFRPGREGEAVVVHLASFRKTDSLPRG